MTACRGALRWPLKILGEIITAKNTGAVAGVHFATQFAAMCKMAFASVAA
jgi:hypothetical protein